VADGIVVSAEKTLSDAQIFAELAAAARNFQEREKTNGI
jgi:hypothetical protein